MPKNDNAQEERFAVTFDIKFWGVRDQIATPGENTLRYGGNTTCVEMRVGEHLFIFDGGTGLRKLGNSLLSQMPIEAYMFFTHCHWDRIQGFPFFVPAFIPINQFWIYGATASNGSTFKQRLSKQMLGPNFPVPIQVMQSKLEFFDLAVEKKQKIGDEVVIENCLLNESHRSVGYRITGQGTTVVYAMSPDYSLNTLNPALLELAHQADVLVLATPNRAYAKDHTGIAPENDQQWQACLKVAKEADVKQVAVSLHSPDHSDGYLDEVEQKMKAIFPNSCLAKEGMVISVP
ncbi:MBL fold metallo-hydrolase [Spirulina sp. CS-785/01]|uniref:MBL fold metallo-hydrolase n=1 Tax=Spirulina sp. CS-785/01 TaxID=3021716 RepID=UPI00232B0B0C|nr:MBL fold metallo-hydrolase [Spirulina sp. CS-785/01]MDB9315052.1 MBL fold metallo-hydrolase [Spirulina sp. CS-785/01]